MSEVKLQRVYFTYCREYKNYFNAGNGYNTLAASDPNLTRELLTEIQNVASEAMSSGGQNDFVFTFTPETSYAQGVFCASFPASDIMGRASQFQSVVYGLPKGVLELRRCVEFYWNKRITDVRKRIDVWPDDAEKAVEENTEPIDLDVLFTELEGNEKEVEAKFWNRLTGKDDKDGKAQRWRGMLSFLLEAYFRRKNVDSCIYLVAPAEDVALAIWGLARLLPKSVISNVSFAIREPRLYRRRTIMGIDGELQKESVDGIIKKIKNGSSDDVIYIAESGQGYGIESESNRWLEFLTSVSSYKDSTDYLDRIDRNNQKFEKYRKNYETKFFNLSIKEQLSRLDVCYRLLSREKELTKSAFNEIQENSLLQFQKAVANNLDFYFKTFSNWSDSDFALILWRIACSENTADSFVVKFNEYFLCESPKKISPEDIISRLCLEERQKEKNNYFYDESKTELIKPLADYLYKKFCPADKLSGEVSRQPDTQRVFLKVFQNIVKKENTEENLKRAFVWHNDSLAFLTFIFLECDSVQWGEDAKHFVKDRILEYCFQDISNLSTENSGFLCILCSSEPILLYLKKQFDPTQFDIFDYINKWITRFHNRDVRLDNEGSLTRWISDVKEYREGKQYYEEMSERFSEIIELYNGLPDQVETNIDDAKKAEKDIQKKLGLGDKTEFFWYDGARDHTLSKKFEQTAQIYSRIPCKDRQDDFLYQLMVKYHNLFFEENKRLTEKYTELNEDEEKAVFKLRRFDKMVKNLSPKDTNSKKFIFGKETYRTRIAALCKLLISSENVWNILGEGEQKKWIKCRAGFSFLKDADNLKFDLGGKVSWNIPDFQPLKKHTITRLHPDTKKNNKNQNIIWIWSGIVANILACILLSVYSWSLSKTKNPEPSTHVKSTDVPGNPGASAPTTPGNVPTDTDNDFSHIEQYISVAEEFLDKGNYSDALSRCKSARGALNIQPHAELEKKVEEIEQRAKALKEESRKPKPSEDAAAGTDKPEDNKDDAGSQTSAEDEKSQE